MTLRLRNTLLIILTIISAAAPAVIIRGFVSGSFFITAGNLAEIIPIVVLTIFITTTSIITFFSFRNTASFEIFFFFIFIFSFVFDIFKITDLIFQPSSAINIYSMIPTRLVYYGRFMGAIAIISAGLFATGLEYQRMGIASIIALVLPAALVIVLPVDSSSAVLGGTWEIGRFHEIAIALGILHSIAALNFYIAGIKNESRDYFVIAAAVLITVGGRELIFYTESIIFQAVGVILLLGGTILFGLRTHKLYLWN